MATATPDPVDGFVPGRVQDASATIRGFLYQVQVTITRWIDLEPNGVLILESGEDIDQIASAPEFAIRGRILEQVKVRGRSITLRSPAALRSLAHFASHLARNPKHRLSFQFTTTAKPGRERLVRLPGGDKGIELWEKIRSSSTDEDYADSLASLAMLIRDSATPDGCDSSSWDQLSAIVSNKGVLPFLEFVRRFHWCCGQDDPGELKGELVYRLGLMEGGSTSDSLSGEARYDQLLSRVLAILSQRGEKRLAHSDLTRILAEPTLTDQDRARLASLEAASSTHDKMIRSISNAVDHLRTKEIPLVLFGQITDGATRIEPSLSLPSPPRLVKHLVHRRKTLDALTTELDEIHWLALYGAYGSGKSHLARLLADRFDGISLGLSMRGLEPEVAGRALEAVIASATLWEHLPETSGIVVLDDLPDVTAQSRFEGALLTLVECAVTAGHKVVSSARRRLPHSTSERCEADAISREAPPFTDAEAYELFAVHTVQPELITSDRIPGLNSLCRGHPILLTALARYLATCQRAPGQMMQAVLLGNAHREEVDLETARALLETVEDSNCRELLYRLASAHIPMTSQEIRELAATPPELDEPTGCLARLDGLWLRVDGDDRFEVSPLVISFGKELPQVVVKKIHRTVAALILRRQRIGIQESTQAVTSLLISKQQDAAAMLLVAGYGALPARRTGWDALGLLLFFPVGHDAGLNVTTELPLRAAQAATASVTGASAAEYEARMKTLASADDLDVIEASALAGSLLLTSVESISADLAITGASFVERLLSNNELAKSVLGSEFENTLHVALAMAALRTWDDIDLMVEFLGSLPVERRRVLLEAVEVKESLRLTLYRPLFTSDRNVTTDAVERLTLIAKRSFELGLLLLAAHSTASLFIVYGEYHNDLDRVIREGKRARRRFENNPAATAVIDATVGQQLLLKRRSGEAIGLLTRALQTPGVFFGTERAFRLVDAIMAAWDTGAAAVGFAGEVASYLAEFEGAAEGSCQMHAQVALVLWRDGQRNHAFNHLEKALIKALEMEDSIRRRQLSACLTHTLLYYVELAETGIPPAQAADGGPLAEPEPRMFSGTREEIADMWRQKEGPAVMRMELGRLAGALDLRDKAYRWMDAAYEVALDARVSTVVSLVGPHAAIEAMRASDWTACLDVCLVNSRAYVCDLNAKNSGRNLFDDSGFDPQSIPESVEDRAAADYRALWLLSRAIVIVLSPLAVESLGHVQDEARGIANAVDQVVELVSNPNDWQQLTASLRRFGETGLSQEELRNSVRKDAERAETKVVNFVAHGLFAFRDDIDIRQAAVSHAGISHLLAQEQPIFGTAILDCLVVIAEYWRTKVRTARFRFRAPAVLDRAISESSDKPPVPRVRSTMLAVLGSLEVRATRETQDWLQDDT